MNTIQQRDGWLYLVRETSPLQFEWYQTIFRAISFQAAFGNHVGEQVEPSDVVHRWQSLDGQRKYQLRSDKPDFIEGVVLEVASTELIIPNKEVESLDLHKAPLDSTVTQPPDTEIVEDTPSRTISKPKGNNARKTKRTRNK